MLIIQTKERNFESRPRSYGTSNSHSYLHTIIKVDSGKYNISKLYKIVSIQVLYMDQEEKEI